MEKEVDSIPATTSKKPKERLGYLDATRAIAIALVLFHHIGKRNSDVYFEFTSTRIQIGQLGVMIFFACSGYVIPTSFERSPSLRRFWISRIFRLYPLYWATLLIAYVATFWDLHTTPRNITGKDWLLNITMIQTAFNAPNVLGIYWTLYWEIVFYVAVSIFTIVGLTKYPVFTSLLVSSLLIARNFITSEQYMINWFAISIMFCGTVWRYWNLGKVKTSVLAFVTFYTALTGEVILYHNLWGRGDISGNGERSFAVMSAAWIGAIIVFGAFIIMGKQQYNWMNNKTLGRFGIIGFSVYLVQGLVLNLIKPFPNDMLWLRSISWVVIVIILANLSYEYIEVPGVKLGRWVNSKFTNKTPQAIGSEKSA